MALKRTHCKRGHELTGDNIVTRRRGPYVSRLCKTCITEQTKIATEKYRTKNKDLIRQRQKKYHNTDREAKLAKRRADYARNPEAHRKRAADYRKAHKDDPVYRAKKKEHDAKYLRENRPKILAYLKERYHENKDVIRARMREYNQRPEVKAARQVVHRRKYDNNENGYRDRSLERKNKCYYERPDQYRASSRRYHNDNKESVIKKRKKERDEVQPVYVRAVLRRAGIATNVLMENPEIVEMLQAHLKLKRLLHSKKKKQ